MTKVEKPRKKEYESEWKLTVPQVDAYNTCHTQWLAYHKQVLEGLKYEISTNKASMTVKNNWLREFNARIDQALKEADG